MMLGVRDIGEFAQILFILALVLGSAIVGAIRKAAQRAKERAEADLRRRSIAPPEEAAAPPAPARPVDGGVLPLRAPGPVPPPLEEDAQRIERQRMAQEQREALRRKQAQAALARRRAAGAAAAAARRPPALPEEEATHLLVAGEGGQSLVHHEDISHSEIGRTSGAAAASRVAPPLADRTDLERAILYHEILSPPLALRPGGGALDPPR